MDQDQLYQKTGIEQEQITESINKLNLMNDPDLMSMIEKSVKEMNALPIHNTDSD